MGRICSEATRAPFRSGREACPDTASTSAHQPEGQHDAQTDVHVCEAVPKVLSLAFMGIENE